MRRLLAPNQRQIHFAAFDGLDKHLITGDMCRHLHPVVGFGELPEYRRNKAFAKIFLQAELHAALQ